MAGSRDQEGSHNLSSEQVASIRAELNAILASSSFTGSKRCHDFLECVVQHALAGHFDQLNERFLGVELYGRKVDFDTGADSIVRVRASDVRRRLAQYYSERLTSSSVMIGLPSGNYIPTFQWTSIEGTKETQAVAPPSSHDESPSFTSLPRRSTFATTVRGFLKPLPIAATLLVLTFIVLTAWHFRSADHNSALEQFWKPYLRNKSKVVFCFGDSRLYWLSPDLRQKVADHQPTIVIHAGDIGRASGGGTPIGDARGLISLTGLLNGRGLVTQALWPEENRKIALDQTNVIYIGSFNNVWTMNLNRNLRFFFEMATVGNTQSWVIRDRLHPDKMWTTEKPGAQQADRSYALITRFFDPNRSHVQMAIGGINEFGTQAASEFLTDEATMSEFAHKAPRGWQERNLQILLEMDISGNIIVNPRIIAIEVW
jgi:hypothetical protein